MRKNSQISKEMTTNKGDGRDRKENFRDRKNNRSGN